jgi:hypothetical protein
MVGVLAWWGAPRDVQADLAHLKSGATVDIGWDYRVVGEKLHFQLGGGMVAVPMSDVRNIEKTERKRSEETAVRERPELPSESASGSASREPAPPGAETGGSRERLVGAAADVLELIRSMEHSETLAREDQEIALAQISSWDQEVRVIVEELGTGAPESALKATGEDLLRTLRGLEEAVEESDLERVKELAQTLEELLSQLEREGG